MIHNYQTRYWQELYDLRSHATYISIYLCKTELHDRYIKIIIAIASSSSIGAWVVWEKFGMLWALIIAASQVLTVISAYLPYKVRLKALTGFQPAIEELSLYAEERWFDVAEGKLTEENIHKLQFEIKSKKAKLQDRYLKNTPLPDREKYLSKAEEQSGQYFKNYYSRLEGSNGIEQPST
jgi:hypothetical protein